MAKRKPAPLPEDFKPDGTAPDGTKFQVRYKNWKGRPYFNIHFTGKPSEEVRDTLKHTLGARWYPAGGFWYCYAGDQVHTEIVAILSGATEQAAEIAMERALGAT